jgi:hypothetical protein
MTRIYPMFVNDYYGSVFERCQALSQLYGQSQERIAAMNASGVDPAVVEMVGHRQQVMGQLRDFFDESGHLLALNRDSLLRRHNVDSMDEILSGVFAGVIEPLESGGVAEDAAVMEKALGGLKDAAGAASKRQVEKDTFAEQTAHMTADVTGLQRDIAAYQTEHSQLIPAIQAKYPGQDWTAAPPKQNPAGQ